MCITNHEIYIVVKLYQILSDCKTHSEMEIRSLIQNLSYKKLKLYIQYLRKIGLNVYYLKSKSVFSLKKKHFFLKKQKLINTLKNSTILIFDTVDSTNQFMLNNFNKLHSLDVCMSEYQWLSRGRNHKKWLSAFGGNIYLSVFWVLSTTNYGIDSCLTIVVSILIAESLLSFGVKNLRIRWPNDLYVNSKKLCGILIEVKRINGISFAVIGIGLNVKNNNMIKYSIGKNYISLDGLGINYDVHELMIDIMNKLYRNLPLFNKFGLQPFIERFYIFDDYLNKQITIFTGNKRISGVSRGINFNGKLILEINGKFVQCI